MRKQRTEYDSPIDVLVLLAKRLSAFEGKYGMESEDFFDRFSKGQMEDSVDFTEWANDYKNYLSNRIEIERQFRHVA